MKQELTSQEYRKKVRETSKNFSDFIDERYSAFFEVAKYAKENKQIPIRILTPFGNFILEASSSDSGD